MEANAPQFKLILGSSSTARKKILGDMGYEFTTMSADIDEKAIRKEKPEDLVMALAEAKAEAIIPRVSIGESEGDAEPTLLITCDQVVVYEGVIREKPSSEAEARQFMKDYANGHAATVSSVLVTNLTTGSRRGEWDKVEAYWILHKVPIPYSHSIEKLCRDDLVESRSWVELELRIWICGLKKKSTTPEMMLKY